MWKNVCLDLYVCGRMYALICMFVVGCLCQSVRGSLYVEGCLWQTMCLDEQNLELMFEALLQAVFDWQWQW